MALWWSTVVVDGMTYYIEQASAGKYVSLWLDAANRSLRVEYREQVLKQVPIKGLLGERLPLAVYLEHMALEARNQLLIGRPIGQQLRLPI